MTQLYSSYLARLNKIPDNICKVLVFLYKPPKFKVPEGVKHELDLAPSPELFKAFKNKELSLQQYLIEYEKVFRSRIPYIMDTTLSELKKYEKVCLICYEKDVNTCHRIIDCKVLNELDEFEYLGEI